MSCDPITITAEERVQEAAERMLEYKVSGLPVIEGEKVIGIITESDIFRMLIDQWDYFTMQHGDPGLVASLVAEAVNP